jgi:hypothetical protein
VVHLLFESGRMMVGLPGKFGVRLREAVHRDSLSSYVGFRPLSARHLLLRPPCNSMFAGFGAQPPLSGECIAHLG